MTPNLHLTRLTGTQEQMGAQHGAFAPVAARKLFAFYRTMPERALAGDVSALQRFVVRQVATAWQASLARTRPAELSARTRAFVAAAAPDASAREKKLIALTMATMDSMQNCVSLAARAQLGPFANPITARTAAAAIPACSTAIAWGSATVDGELMFARNFDFPGVGIWDDAAAFTLCAPTTGQRYGFFGARGADAPVVTVVNEAGLVIAPHTRWHRDVTWSGAMIVDLVHELARRAETLDDAIKIARETPASSSWGIAIGSAREKSALVLELGGPHVEIVRPTGPRRRNETLTCTNRYRSDGMQHGQLAASHAWAHHSDHREQRLRGLVEGRTAPLTLPELLGFLGDRELAGARRHFGSILAQPTNVHAVAISPATRHALVGIDRAPCCEGTVADLGWTWEGPSGDWDLAKHEGSGFAARAVDIVAPHDPATLHVREAVRVFEQVHDVAAARTSLDRAIAAAPEDPSLQLAAAWLAVEDRAHDRAISHVRAGLALEADPYRRGQLFACGARAATTAAERTRWLAELDRHHCDGVEELRRRARRKAPLKTNLLMADAF